MDNLPFVFGVVAFAAAVVAVLFFLKPRKKDEPREAPSTHSTGIPDGMEQDYEAGVEPCKCGVPVMYTLHTCRHCVHLKDFLDARGVEHRLVYVDDFQDPARSKIMTVLRSFNPRGSFPTLVMPDGRSSVGFRENVVREMLGLPDAD